MKIRYTYLMATVAALGAQWPLASMAQLAASDKVLEEVVVKALRRDASLKDVADSITAFSNEEIQRVGIRRLNDVARLTPNLRFSDDQEVGVGTITIRGVTQNRGIGETPVAFVVDGVSVNNSLLSTQDFFDVEQIEVLRGPQGALFGRNAVAGAINITTARPTSEFTARARGQLAQGDDVSFEGAFSGPLLGERFLGRAAFFFQDRRGQLYNNTINRYVDYKKSIGVRLRGLLDISDALQLDLRYQHSDQEGGSGYFMPGTVDNEENRLPGDTFPFPLNNTTYTIQANLRGESDVVFDEYTARLDYDGSWGTFSSITAYNDLESNNDQDLDATALDFLNIVVNDDATQFSQELRIQSRDDAPLRWLGGLYYADQTRDRSLATFLNVAGFASGGDWSPENAFFVPQPPAVLGEEYDTRAVYAQLDFDLAERWGLLLAARYDRVKRSNETNNPRANGTATFSEFQPKIQLSFAASDELNLFATYAEGFRPGGFNTLANSPEVQFASRFESETLSNFELGAKYRSPAENVFVNFAAFYIDYEGQQFFLFDPLGSQALINADESYIAGAELELAWNPGSGWILSGAYGFTESEIEKIAQAPGLNVSVDDIIGREVPNAPVYSLNLAADYQRELGAYLFDGRVEYERRGTTWFTIDNLDFQEPYGIFNLRASLARGDWALTVFVNNVLDEEWIDFYFSRKYIGLRTDIAWPSSKRLMGMELAWRF